MSIFYFGCRREAGHYLWGPGRAMWRSSDVPADFPCTMTPDATFLPPRDNPEVEGLASFFHLNGWTIISFWDRSVDSRGKCNSTFLARGVMTFDAICEKAKAEFPDVWQRFKFPIMIRQEPRP